MKLGRTFSRLVGYSHLVVLYLLYPLSTYADAFVADTMRVQIRGDYFEAAGGRMNSLALGTPHVGAVYGVTAKARNKIYPDISLYICSDQDARLLVENRASQCRGVNRQGGVAKFTVQAARGEPHYLILDNRYSLVTKKKVDVEVYITTTMPAEMKASMTEMFNRLSDDIQATFKVEAFNFSLKPCGTENAYSVTATGDITFCSELFFGLLDQKLVGAIPAILYHEIGHSLLNLLGLPNYDNEETVDEFALVMLYWEGQQEKAIDWIRYYETKNSRVEAAHSLQNDVRHPLSVQRIRNIQRILRNPNDVIRRWNQLLYPHMTENGLKNLQNKSPQYVDRELMNKYLELASDNH